MVIHGGAGSLRANEKLHKARQESLERILSTVYPRLERGTAAMEAAAEAVVWLENDPLYNAGLGSKLQSDGKIRMSASIMDGSRRRFGGCVNVERVKNPILLAKRLLSERDRVLAGPGAEKFASTMGLSFSSPYTKERREQYRERILGKSGTVGAVALDSRGRLAAATSTGGRGLEYPGRVSDTPTVAANFANLVCAVSATGVGEEIVEFAVAATICAQVEAAISLKRASQSLLQKARKNRAHFGFIALDRRGVIVGATTTEHLIWAVASPRGIEVYP